MNRVLNFTWRRLKSTKFIDDRHLERLQTQKRKANLERWSRIPGLVIYGGILGGAIIFYRIYASKQALLEMIDEVIPKDGNFNSNFKMVVYKDCVVTEDMVSTGLLKKIESFRLLQDDIIVASFPKSGTTWLQEVVYEICHPESIDKFNSTREIMEDKFPYLEYVYPGIREIERRKSKRLLKTHLPIHLLPSDALKTGEEGKSKIIYIYRNPKDVVVSYFYFLKMLSYTAYSGDFETFFKHFITNKLPYAPYFSHINGYCEKGRKDPSRFLIISYEEMHSDPERTIRKVMEFLNVKLSESQVAKIVKNTSFESMKSNPSTNYSHWKTWGLQRTNESDFLRKGMVGDHKHHFSPELDVMFDQWFEKYNSEDIKFQFK